MLENTTADRAGLAWPGAFGLFLTTGRKDLDRWLGYFVSVRRQRRSVRVTSHSQMTNAARFCCQNFYQRLMLNDDWRLDVTRSVSHVSDGQIRENYCRHRIWARAFTYQVCVSSMNYTRQGNSNTPTFKDWPRNNRTRSAVSFPWVLPVCFYCPVYHIAPSSYMGTRSIFCHLIFHRFHCLLLLQL